MLQAAGVREVVRVDRSGLLRARREPAARAAKRLSEDEVLPCLRIRPADRVLGPAGAVRRVFAGDEQVRREHAIVFDLQQPVRPSRRKEVFLLVPRRRRRVDQDAAVGRRSAHLVGVALVIQHAHHVLLRRLPLALERVLLEPRPIDVLARRAEDTHVLRRVRAVEPRLVLRDRPAEIDVHVRDLLVVVRRVGRHAARGERRRYVRRLELVVREVAVRAALELVRAALEDQVVADAAGRLLDVVPGGRDLHLIEGVEIEVGRRAAAFVGDDDPVERPDGVALMAFGDEAAHLARLVAGDVHAVGDDPRYGSQQRPRIARRRNRLQIGRGHRRRRPHGARVDERRRRGHRHLLLDAGELQRDGNLDARADDHGDVRPRELREPADLDGDLVLARKHVEEPEAAVGGRHERGQARRSGERDGRAGHDAALVVFHDAGDAAALGRLGGRRQRRAGAEHYQEQGSSNHDRPP